MVDILIIYGDINNLKNLKEILLEAREDVNNMPDWMTKQEPFPGQSWEEYLKIEVGQGPTADLSCCPGARK